MSDLDYWEQNMPWTFRDLKERPSYEKRREMRYALQDYMGDAIGFSRYGGKSVLEIGSGNGLDAAEFARNGALVLATDASSLGVAETERTRAESGQKFEVVKLDGVDALPFPDGRFDLVYSFGVLHHMTDPAPVVREMRRVVKPEGKAVAMLYNRDSLLFAYSSLHGLPIERTEGAYRVTPYTPDEARSLFKPFSSVRAEDHYDVVDLPQERKVKVAGIRGRGLGWHLVVTAIP